MDLELIAGHEAGQLSEVIAWIVAKVLYEVGDLKPVDRRVFAMTHDLKSLFGKGEG